MNPKTFCLAPWTHALVHTDGTMRACCAITTESDIKFTDYKTWWNGQDMQTLRSDLHNGVRTSACKRCWHDEDMGKESLRKNYNNLFRKFTDFNNIRQSSKTDFKSAVLPTAWDLRLGNICNLKCVMCNSEFSHLIQQEIREFQKSIPPELNISADNLETMNWCDTNEATEFLEEIFKHAQWLRLQGGEPLAVKKIQDIIPNINKQSTLALTTNGTVLTEKLEELFKNQHRVEFSVSVESVSPANDVIRYGSNWHTIDANIQKIKQYPRADLQLNHTLQVTSVFYLPDVIRYCEANDLHVNIVRLVGPEYLSLDACPKKYLDQLVEEINNIDIHHPKNQYIKSLINTSVKQAQFNIDLWNNFWKYVAYLDQIRPTKFSTVLPHNFKKDLT